jgi:hypothetical protein
MSESRRDRLVEIQKREQLKGLLINKFKVKYGATQALNKFIENEVQKFLTNERLTEASLKALDAKIARETDNRDRKSQILDDHKSQRSQSARSQISRRSLGQRSTGGLSHQALSEFNKRNGEDNVSRGVPSIRSKRSAVSSYASKRSGISQILSGKPSHYSEIDENDEWVAIQKFNTLLHFEEQK